MHIDSRHGGFRRVATATAMTFVRHLGLALLCLLCLAGLRPVQAQSLESVLAPGPVIQGHVKTESDCKACHSRFDRNAQDKLCTSCHKDVGEDIRLHNGFHGKRETQPQCRSCHTEHKGRDAKLASFDTKRFDHRQTDYALLDKHVGVECAKCHLPGKRWREAPSTCAACHAKDDVHKGGLGKQCADCHVVRGWREARFDHDKTRFPLTGKHVPVQCKSCHLDNHFKDTPSTCYACHKKVDEHKGQYGEKCETCHGTTAWKPSTFRHDTDTHFVLKDKHREVKCAACHTGGLPIYQHKLGTACVDCHLKDDKHKGTLGRQCQDCHVERGWKESAGFDHQKTRFPLLGGHLKPACKDCHTDALYRQTPNRCIDCHRKDDRHQGNLGEACGDCHAEQNWKPLPGRFDHERTKFPLRNAHAARAVKCQDCHETQRAFRGTPRTCVSCHKRDDPHQGSLGERCDECHSDRDWQVARFDHARTRFPLVGRHLVVSCQSCHASNRYKQAPSDCLSCHRKDDKHKGALGTACATCHNERAWPVWQFDHDRSTRYRLEGQHRSLRCEACHEQPAPPGAKIAKVGSDCLACHRKDDAHEGRFGTRCEQCHLPENWRQIRQATSRPPLAPTATGLR